MASKRIEDEHVRLLNNLMMKTGLECPKPVESASEVVVSVIEEDQNTTTEEAVVEEIALEEEITEESATPPPEEPEIFPTPSLRRVIPDKLRKIENYNRIHTLPEEFNTDIDPTAIPKIATSSPQTYIDVLANMVGCKDYKSSLAEYWFLDTLANLLRRSQEDGMDRPSQAVLILWFCEWMKEMQHFDAADRKRMIRRFKDNMLSAAKYIAEEERLPAPKDIKVYYKALPEEIFKTLPAPRVVPSANLVTFRSAAYECSLRDLICISHYIFDLFSTDFQYNLVRSVFTFSPEYKQIDDPYVIHNPKRMYAALKVKPPKAPKPPKAKPGPTKGKGKEVLTEEFLALMELKAKEERELEELELLSLEDYNKRSHILPLSMAADDELFNKYWPPPTPEPEPEPSSPPPTGKKGKKK